jgi:hypothetical protein
LADEKNVSAEDDDDDDDETQDSSIDEISEGEDSADNGEIDLVHEFELSQKDAHINQTRSWTTDDQDVFIVQDDDFLSAIVSSTAPSTLQRNQPTSIMKMNANKSMDNLHDQQSFKPKVRFNLDPQYEREREWNKVNKLLGNSVEWTDEFEV